MPRIFRFESAEGVCDGRNRVFRTRQPYFGKTLHVFLNGMLQLAAANDGWVELGTDRFLMKEPPLIDDVVAVCYLPV